MTATDLLDKGKQYSKKAAAAYATYKGAVATADRLANQYFHIWTIDQDYARLTYDAAQKLAVEHQRPLPGAPKKVSARGNRNDTQRFNAPTWTWMPIKGVSLALQVRMNLAEKFDNVIEFRAPRQSDLEAFQKHVAEVEAELMEEEQQIDLDWKPTVYTQIMAWTGGHWDVRKERVARTFQSVVLPAELQAEIEADLQRFGQSRKRLQRLEMPWRRGYLLSGPPGTGKTSVSLAIAGALDFNLASLSLTDLGSDGELRKSISSLRPRTVLVIEDIDAYTVSHERDHNSAKDGALSLSGLLNSLDGFETPEGLVTILTTNHVDKLDAALTRHGRIDQHYYLGHIEAPELERLFGWFYETEVPSPAPAETGLAEIAPAEIAELFKQHLDAPEAGWNAVLERIGATSQRPVLRLSA